MHPIAVVQFMFVAKHAITNDAHSLPKTMSLVKCGNWCYMDRDCVSFFHESTLQKCYPLTRNIQKNNDNTTGAVRYYRQRNMKEQECHEKGHSYSYSGDLCYKQSASEKTWTSAQSDCETLGGTLFNVDTPAKHNFFVDVVRRETSGKRFFIGGSKEHGGAWRWTDGRNIEKFHWLPNEPDNLIVPQRCLQYSQRQGHYLWDNTLCNYPKHYYCHYP